MAIIPESRYAGRITPASPSYPYGSARNITSPGDGTGTPWEAAIVNDIFGFQQALLMEADVVPTGNPDAVGASQYLDALKILTQVTVQDYAGLQAVDTTKITRIWAEELWPGVKGSGGLFRWDATADKAKANGVVDIDPIVPLLNQGSGSGSGCWVRVLVGPLTIEMGGATGSGDDTVNVLRIHDYAVSAGIRSVLVASGSYSISETAKISDVIWVGDGRFIGPQRETVHSIYEPTGTFFPQLHRERNLTQFAQTDAPVVAIIGDSLSTETPTVTFDGVDSLWGLLQKRLRETNPDADFTMYNFGIGGATFSNANPTTALNTTGLTLPSWAGDGSLPWLDYVEAVSPDIIFVNFGMNDRQNFVTAQFRAFVNGLNSFTKVPDIIFITPMVPSKMTTDPSISDNIAQEGRDFVANFIRSWCDYNLQAYIDVNRRCNMVRDGFDPTSSSFTWDGATNSDIPFTATELCHSFGFNVDIPTVGATTFATGFYIPLSEAMPNSKSWFEIDDDAGKVRVRFWYIDEPTPALSYTSGVTTPTSGAINFNIFVKNNTVSIKLGGAVIFEGNIVRHGGQFLPSISMKDASTLTCSVKFYKGDYLRVMPQLTDRDLWGTDGTEGGLTGGNNKNHPTSLGANSIYWEILKNVDLRQPVMTEGSTEYPGTTQRKVGIRKKYPKGVLHISKNEAISDSPDLDANNVVIEDAAAPGLSLLSNSTGVARVNFGDPENAASGQYVYDHNTDTHALMIGGAPKLQLSASRATFGTEVRQLAEDGISPVNIPLRSMQFSLVSDTQLNIYVRGNDNVVRHATLTLA